MPLYKHTSKNIINATLSKQEVWYSIPGPVEFGTVSSMTRHRCDVSSELCCPGAKLLVRAPSLVTHFGVIPRDNVDFFDFESQQKISILTNKIVIFAIPETETTWGRADGLKLYCKFVFSLRSITCEEKVA